MMRRLIGIAGKKNTGKTTVGDHLWHRHGYFSMAFADHVKRVAAVLFDWDMLMLESREYKEAFDPNIGMTRREALQRLGTEAIQGEFGEMFWVNSWLKAYGYVKNEPVVVTDVRFEHEASAIRALGGVIVHLKRAVDNTDAHGSEAGIAHQAEDYVIANTGTLEELFDQVGGLVALMEAR